MKLLTTAIIIGAVVFAVTEVKAQNFACINGNGCASGTAVAAVALDPARIASPFKVDEAGRVICSPMYVPELQVQPLVYHCGSREDRQHRYPVCLLIRRPR